MKGNETHFYDAAGGHHITPAGGSEIHAVDPINGEPVDILDPTDLPGEQITGPEMIEERFLQWLNGARVG